MELNRHIDFKSMFLELYKEQEEYIIEKRNEMVHFETLIQFVQNGDIDEFEVITEDCDINDKKIHFVFGMDLERPNESSNYVATADYHIIYDRGAEEFTTCDYEQG